jgi:hypothetical protein
MEGSGSVERIQEAQQHTDPTDPDPEHAADGVQCTVLVAYSFLKVHLHHSSKIKLIKKSKNRRNQDFLHLLLINGRIRIRTNKLRICGSRRPKTIRNTAANSVQCTVLVSAFMYHEVIPEDVPAGLVGEKAEQVGPPRHFRPPLPLPVQYTGDI